MKTLSALTFAALTALLIQSAGAQPKINNTLQPPPAGIKVDGDIKEWGDSLRYYNEEKKLNYSLANDKENLYMAIRVNDHTEQMRILNAGLTLSVNPKGKKKETYSITFPVGDPNAPAAGLAAMAAADPQQEDRDAMMRARLSKLRNIKVVGFPDIESDIITTANTYGIQVALNYDENGYMVYEAAIPLKFFHAENTDKSEWAFNIKINGITRPSKNGGDTDSAGGMGGGRGGMGGGRGGMGGGRGGMGGGRGGMAGGRGGMGGGRGGESSGDRSEMAKSVDFWEKFYLGGG